MHWITYFVRKTAQNLRREPLLHGATVLTLATAFLCFSSFLAVAIGVGTLASRWASDFHLSVYLEEGVSSEEAAEIAGTLERLEQVEAATIVPSAEMRERLVTAVGEDPDIAGLDARLFPTTIEVRLSDDVQDPALIGNLSERLSGLQSVAQVETYGDLFHRLRTVTTVTRAVAIALGVIVLLATLLVVSNTVRLSLLRRKEEIEIQKLCGATDRFVQVPFLLAGALQGLVGALVSLGLLALTAALLERAIGGLLPALGGGGPGGLPFLAAAAVVLGGTALGLAGAHLSVSRFLRSAP